MAHGERDWRQLDVRLCGAGRPVDRSMPMIATKFLLGPVAQRMSIEVPRCSVGKMKRSPQPFSQIGRAQSQSVIEASGIGCSALP